MTSMLTKPFFFKRVLTALLALCAFTGLTTAAPEVRATTDSSGISVEHRIADIRQRFEKLKTLDTEAALKIKAKSHLAQWYNFPNWPNWNDWRNWPNHRWLNW